MFNPGMLKKMQQLQKEIEEKNDAFNEKIFSIEKQGIEIKVKGSKKIVSIKVKDDILLDPEDSETLEDLLILALNELFARVDEEHEKITPAMPNLGF